MNSAFSSWKNLRRAPYQSLTALMVVITTFFMVYIFSTTLYFGEKILNFFETRPQILLFFRPEISDTEAGAAASLLSQLDYVDQIQIISKNEAFANYQSANQDEPLLIELLTADLFPASLSITATSPEGLEKISTEIGKLDGVDEVDYRRDVINQFLRWTQLIRNVGLAACTLFTIQFILVIMVITSMKVATRRRNINIMSVLGVNRHAIKGTFIRESMWLGLIGSLIAFGLAQVLLYYLSPALINFLGDIQVLPLAWEFLAIQVAIGSVFAAFLAAFSAWMATTRLIKK
jgi:cell division transport system permease protein